MSTVIDAEIKVRHLLLTHPTHTFGWVQKHQPDLSGLFSDPLTYSQPWKAGQIW